MREVVAASVKRAARRTPIGGLRSCRRWVRSTPGTCRSSKPHIRSPTSSSCRSSSTRCSSANHSTSPAIRGRSKLISPRAPTAAVDAVYAPTAAAMYPEGFDTRVAARRRSPRRWRARAGPDTSMEWPPWSPSSSPPSHPTLPCSARRISSSWPSSGASSPISTSVSTSPDVRPFANLTAWRSRVAISGSRRNSARRPLRFHGRSSRHGEQRVEPDASIDDMIASATSVVEAEPLASLDYVSVFDADTLDVVRDRRRLGSHVRSVPNRHRRPLR